MARKATIMVDGKGIDFEITESDLNIGSSSSKTEPEIRITEADINKDISSADVIKITESDLAETKKHKPGIVINYRDTARSHGEWWAGLVKDGINFIQNLRRDFRWWGGGELGKRKLEEFQRIEKERADVEAVFNSVVIITDRYPVYCGCFLRQT